MLDIETRRRIDNARDILVGKVPDPKSQVEQITIALIYKFMDDMDNEAKELGGKATFFKGEFSKYSWSNIFDPKLGGIELITLYGEAITKMNQNKYIPQLFRDIFKNAFLPYRDPETLKSFLKEINDFHYDHSERLGDAFEYLLSVLGVQGDAGSLRTPRHIIDFIVEVIAPRKNETILDPSCGTAGFLISSYKHILKQNIDNKKGLTPDDRKRLMNSITGYDISPDMVRLSLVNMYLHGFQTPKIYEYDSLTSDDRWNDTFDIILANPPFMTPKGGIRPHKRFQIQANRSEVLFVDYIMEHIAIDGRAGVIVPEGIIFQSGNAYKALRKELVENNYLYAVVSLPAGVFNPYSGVKTSILLMDRTLAKKTKDILFIKIENDGFDLGAQRREVDKNDLPDALKILKEYKNILSSSHPFSPRRHSALDSRLRGNDIRNIFHIVLKTKISESGDYNLTGDRYRERIVHVHKDWPMVELGGVLQNKPQYGSGAAKSPFDGKNRYIRITDITDNGILKEDEMVSPSILEKECLLTENDFLIARSGSVGRSYLHHKNNLNCYFAGYLIRFPLDFKKVLPKYVFFLTRGQQFADFIYRYRKDGTLSNINAKEYQEFLFPLPPLFVQQEIVAEIEGYQKIIDGSRQVVENYKPKIKIDESWELVELGEVCLINDKTINPEEEYGEGLFYYIDISSVENCSGKILLNNQLKGIEAPSRARRRIFNGDILLSTVRPNLKAFAYLTGIPENAVASTGFAVLTPTKHILGRFVYYLLFEDTVLSQMIERMGKGSYPSINQKDVEQLKIPLPPLKIQKQIVAQIEEEQKLIEANKKLIEIFEGKIKAKIAEVWG